MSGDDGSGSGSGSESEDLSTTGLIATRAKRSTAGNLYATLRANLDDEDLQRDLLAEDDEEDAGDYEGSDAERGDDDAGLESSSDEEDAGPPKEGEAEDLEGEKALKRQERVEQKRKRKVHEARLKLPAWRKKQQKRVKLADDVKTEDGNTSERPRKKSERSNWLPSATDAPVRQSARASAVANRETIHANLKQSAVRSENQRRVMKDAAEREKSKRWMEDLTQEERLKKCERIERETAKELGRWEREEAERQRLREEALAAKRNRGIDGPVFRKWSGSVLWVGDKIRVRRLDHGSQNVEEIKLPREGEDRKHMPMADYPDDLQPSMAAHTLLYFSDSPDGSLMELDGPQDQEPLSVPVTEPSAFSWLPGIHEHAAQADGSASTSSPQPPVTTINPYMPSAPTINTTPLAPVSTKAQVTPTPVAAQPMPSQTYNGWQPGTHTFAIQPSATSKPAPPPPPPPPPEPQIREQAQRSLLVLENFENLGTYFSSTTRRSRSAKDTSHLDSDPLKDILLPGAYPSFNPDETKYILAKHKKKAGEYYLVPPTTTKSRCALTSWPARYRDPKTGLAYADYHQYRTIRRILAGGIQWSALLGCWVGPAYGALGRPARGVPDAFAGIERPPVTAASTEAAPAVKAVDQGAVKTEKLTT